MEGSTRKSSIVPIKPIVAQSPQHLPVGTVLADNAAFVATFASDLRALPSSSTTVAQRFLLLLAAFLHFLTFVG